MIPEKVVGMRAERAARNQINWIDLNGNVCSLEIRPRLTTSARMKKELQTRL
jgi:hypothetical protein